MTAIKTQNNFMIQKNWNDVYKYNDIFDLPWFDLETKPELKNVIDNLPIKSGNALDVGCGLGQVSRYLAQIGFKTTAIDISEEAIKWCKKLNDTGFSIDYIVADSTSFISSKKFDLIVDFLHFHDVQIEYYKKYLFNIKKLIVKRGYFILAWLYSVNKNLTSFNGIKFRKSIYANDINVFFCSISNIKIILEEFKILKTFIINVGKSDDDYLAKLLLLQHQ